MGVFILFIGMLFMEFILFIGDIEFIEFIFVCMLLGCIFILGVILRLVIFGGVMVLVMLFMLGGE